MNGASLNGTCRQLAVLPAIMLSEKLFRALQQQLRNLCSRHSRALLNLKSLRMCPNFQGLDSPSAECTLAAPDSIFGMQCAQAPHLQQ